MPQSLINALGFGFCWLAVWLLISALPMFGGTNKKMRFRIILIGISSSLFGGFICYTSSLAGDRQIAALLLALTSASTCAAFLLIGCTFGFLPFRKPDRPPVTGYRATPPDGPHT